MIPQRRERLPALRTAVPAPREIPEHLEPGQVRVIPPPRPRPRPPLHVLPVGAIPCPPAASSIITAAGRRLRRRLLRRPAEQHPLQHCETSAELLQLSVPLRIPLQKTRDLLPQPRDLRPLPLRQLRQLPVRVQRHSQRITRRCLSIRNHASRNRHAAHQTPSAAANHAPRASVSRPQAPDDADSHVTRFPKTYDPSAWFASYRGFLLPYARVAQSAHAATLVIGTELNSLGGNPGWPALVRAISSVYRGQLAYDENFDSFQNHDTNLPVPTFGVDAYPRFQLPDSASVGELARSWEGWLGSHSAGVLHKTVLSEVGIAAVAGAYAFPGAWLGTADSPIVPGVQANWYSAVCRAFSTEKLAGIYWWEVNFDANPAKPADFLRDRLTFLDRPAQHVISACFTSITVSKKGHG